MEDVFVGFDKRTERITLDSIGDTLQCEFSKRDHGFVSPVLNGLAGLRPTKEARPETICAAKKCHSLDSGRLDRWLDLLESKLTAKGEHLKKWKKLPNQNPHREPFNWERCEFFRQLFGNFRLLLSDAEIKEWSDFTDTSDDFYPAEWIDHDVIINCYHGADLLHIERGCYGSIDPDHLRAGEKRRRLNILGGRYEEKLPTPKPKPLVGGIADETIAEQEGFTPTADQEELSNLSRLINEQVAKGYISQPRNSWSDIINDLKKDGSTPELITSLFGQLSSDKWRVIYHGMLANAHSTTVGCPHRVMDIQLFLENIHAQLSAAITLMTGAPLAMQSRKDFSKMSAAYLDAVHSAAEWISDPTTKFSSIKDIFNSFEEKFWMQQWSTTGHSNPISVIASCLDLSEYFLQFRVRSGRRGAAIVTWYDAITHMVLYAIADSCPFGSLASIILALRFSFWLQESLRKICRILACIYVDDIASFCKLLNGRRVHKFILWLLKWLGIPVSAKEKANYRGSNPLSLGCRMALGCIDYIGLDIPLEKRERLYRLAKEMLNGTTDITWKKVEQLRGFLSHLFAMLQSHSPLPELGLLFAAQERALNISRSGFRYLLMAVMVIAHELPPLRLKLSGLMESPIRMWVDATPSQIGYLLECRSRSGEQWRLAGVLSFNWDGWKAGFFRAHNGTRIRITEALGPFCCTLTCLDRLRGRRCLVLTDNIGDGACLVTGRHKQLYVRLICSACRSLWRAVQAICWVVYVNTVHNDRSDRLSRTTERSKILQAMLDMGVTEVVDTSTLWWLQSQDKATEILRDYASQGKLAAPFVLIYGAQ